MIVDDDLDEAKLTKRTIEVLRPEFDIELIGSGKGLMAYLDGQEPYGNRMAHPLPSVILLDLKMPQPDGFAVLEWLQGRPKHVGIPIIVVSGYSDLSHLKRAYSLCAKAFLVKPISAQAFANVLQSLNITV